jgi:hypothetical protein
MDSVSQGATPVTERLRWPMPRRTIALTVVIIVLLGVVIWQVVNSVRSSIHLSFAAEQTEIFEDMVTKASQSLSQTPANVEAAVSYLVYAHGYYPSGTKQTQGSRLDRIVERCRSVAETRIIKMMRDATGRDLGNNVEDWVAEFGDNPP